MKGSIKVQVSNSHISFTLELERNITIICGDSATGKTTLIGMLRDYEENSRSSLYFSFSTFDYRYFELITVFNGKYKLLEPQKCPHNPEVVGSSPASATKKS